MNTKNQINDGGPAFPILRSDQAGMSLRDWFAGQASESDVRHWRNMLGFDCTREMAKYAYADAMLAARNNTKL